MKRLVPIVIAAALVSGVPGVAFANGGCAPPPPETSTYSSPAVPTTLGPAQARGGPDHAGATLGEGYLFAGPVGGGYGVYGVIPFVLFVGDRELVYGPDFAVSVRPDKPTGRPVDGCIQDYEP